MAINWVFSDTGRRYVLNLENCALTYLADRRGDRAGATVTRDRTVLNRLVLREEPKREAQGRRSPDTVQSRDAGWAGTPAR